MGAAEDDQAKRGQLLRKALAEHIRFAKKTDQVRRWQKQRWIEVDEVVISNGRNACLGKYILEKRLYAFGLAGDICQALAFSLRVIGAQKYVQGQGVHSGRLGCRRSNKSRSTFSRSMRTRVYWLR